MSSDRIVVLNVDDYEAGRYASSRVLRQAGFDVVEAATGEEAIRLAASVPDLIVLDVNLPDVNGFEVCRRIKADPETAGIPVLYLSAAYRASEHRVQGLELGADGYLTQPVDPRELVATVNALLRSRHVRDAVDRSEERFRSLMTATSDIIWTTGPDGVLVGEQPDWSRVHGAATRGVRERRVAGRRPPRRPRVDGEALVGGGGAARGVRARASPAQPPRGVPPHARARPPRPGARRERAGVGGGARRHHRAEAGRAGAPRSERAAAVPGRRGQPPADDGRPAGVRRPLFADLSRYLDLELFFNYLLDPEEGRLVLRSYGGIAPEAAAGIEHLRLGEAVCGHAAATPSSEMVERVQHAPTTPAPT